MQEENFPDIFNEQYDSGHPPESYNKKLERSNSDHIIAGTCAGIAKYFNTEPAVIRIFFILTILLGFWSIAAYLIASYLIPKEKDSRELSSEEKKQLKKTNFRTVLSGVMIYTGIYSGFASIGFYSPWGFWIFNYSYILPFIAIGFGIFLFFNYVRDEIEYSTPPAIKFYRSRENKIFFGVCVGLGRYLNNTDPTSIRIIIVVASMLTLGLLIPAYLLIALLSNYDDAGEI
ncbi:MAG TPA: PspC domain-containing protein [Melioribacteraceae bacterium]|nr:PspC domain-containing protein [Melioribacteraceae bacterium]